MSFIDISNNKFNLTPFGDVAISTSVFKYGNGSCAFDGNGDYLTIPFNSAFNFGTEDFTFEAWIYPTSTSGRRGIYATSGGSGSVYKFVIHLDSGILKVHINNAAGINTYWNGTSAITANIWTHIAVIRAGGIWTLYINGVANGTGTNTFNITATNETTYIGYGGEAYFTEFVGYIDELRITKGIARYTANFTPPTSELSSVGDANFNNVSLLLNFNSLPFKDSSGFDFLPSSVGNARLVNWSTPPPPFGNGAANFDGAGDYLELPLDSAFDFGNGDFTIECWFFSTSSGFQTIIARWGSGGNAFFLGTNIATPDVQFYVNDTLACQGGVPIINRWNHLAVSRNGSSIRLFLNGTQVGNTYNIGTSAVIASTEKLKIGEDNNSSNPAFRGYIDDVRITKGVGRYSANFTPPTSELTSVGDTYFSNVSLLLNMNSIPITDASVNNFSVSLFGNVNISKPPPPYGNAALYCDGSGDYLSIVPQNNAFNFLNQDFTIEGWFYALGNQTGGSLISTRLSAVYAPWELQIGYIGANRLGLLIRSGNSWYGNVYYSTSTIPLNQWVHFAWVCKAGYHTLYVNGTADSVIKDRYAPILSAYAQPSNVYIGKGGDGDFNGYIDDFKVTNGIARYTANFIPPIKGQKLFDPSINSVILLANMEFSNNSTQVFRDFSKNNLLISPVGNATIFNNGQSKVGNGLAYFDGTGDYLQINEVSEFDFYNTDFTMEMWVFLSSAKTSGLISTRLTNIISPWELQITSAGKIKLLIQSGASAWYNSGNYLSSNTLLTSQWIHISWVYQGGKHYIYVNGFIDPNLDGIDAPILQSYSSPSAIYIGKGGEGDYHGYIDELRITKGVARNVGITVTPKSEMPNTTIDPYYNNVILLLNMNGANGSTTFTDSSISNRSITRFGNTNINTTIKKFGTGSAYFDGSGDYLQTTISNSDWSPGVNGEPFTIELWVYLLSASGTQVFISKHGGTNTWNGTTGLNFNFYYTGTILYFEYWGGAARSIGNTISFPTNQWVHLAAVYDGYTTYIFLNGVRLPTSNTAQYNATTSATTLEIGGQISGSFPVNGYIDDVRITKGIARYSYLVSTSEFYTYKLTPFTNNISLSYSLVAFWKLDNLKDVSNNRNSLTNTGNIQFVSGKIGNCAQFGTGTLSIGSLYPTVTAPSTQAISVSFWANPTSNVLGSVIGARNSAGSNALNIHNQAGGSLNMNNGISTDVVIANAFTVGTWKHYVCIVSNGRTKVYINGSLVHNGTAGVTYGNSISILNIGRFPDGNQQFNGLIDAVGIWQRELNQEEVNLLYNSGNGLEG